MREQFLGNLLVVRHEAIVEDCDTLLLIKHGVGLLVPHCVFARGVARVQDSDSAFQLWFFGLLLVLAAPLFNLQGIQILIHLEETVVLLVDQHLILQHVFIVCHPHHGHGQLLRAQTGELT